MAVYLLFMREGAVRDEDAFRTYALGARNAASSVAYDRLIAYTPIAAIEGEPADGVVLLKFDNEADARAWFDRKDYQDVVPFRKKAADYRVMLIEGV